MEALKSNLFGIDEKSYFYSIEPTFLRYVLALKKTLTRPIYLANCTNIFLFRVMKSNVS